MFPNSWPGRGLLLLRLVTGILLIRDGVYTMLGTPQLQTIFLESLALAAGVLLLAGLWTPIAGTLVVLVELWFALSRTNALENAILLAALGAALAVLGPGACSIDAKRYGRKRIAI